MNISLPNSSKPYIAILGDSIDAYNKTYSVLGIYKSNAILIKNSSVGGNTLGDMLARYDNDLGGESFNLLIVKGGTNDAGQGVSISTSISNLQSIIAKTRAKGAEVLIVLPPPRSDSYIDKVMKLRDAISNYCIANHFYVIDPFEDYIDSSTGGWIAGASDDQVHPDYEVRYPVALKLSSEIDRIFQYSDVTRPKSNIIGNGTFSNPLFITDSNTDGYANGYATGAIGTGSLATKAGVLGKVQRFIASGAPESCVLLNLIDGSVNQLSNLLVTSRVCIETFDDSYTLNAFLLGKTSNEKIYLLQDAKGNMDVRCSIIIKPNGQDSDYYYVVEVKKTGAGNINARIEISESQIYEL